MNSPEEKNTLLAIGLNLLLPGVGYMYMGRIGLGIAALVLVVGIYLVTPLLGLLLVWVAMNAIMAIDMTILGVSRRSRCWSGPP